MNYTLITGASRGIGEAMAEYCALKKMNLLLVARTYDTLKQVAERISNEYNVDVQFFAVDLRHPEAISQLFHWIRDLNIKLNILINNAGVGLYGKFEELPIDAQLEVIQLNQLAMVRMVHQFLPMLKENPKSYILNVASTACYQPIPYMSIYAATESFIHSFTLALKEELKGQNVFVSCLNPGPTATDFFERAGLEKHAVNSEDIKMTKEEVAEAGINGVLSGVSEIIPGTNNAIGAYLSKIFPNKLIVKTVSGLFAPKE